MNKQSCNVCGKQVTKLLRHKEKVHGMTIVCTEAVSVKDIVKLLRMVPGSLDDLILFEKHQDLLTNFVENGKELPTKIFQKLYNILEKYISSKYKLAFCASGPSRHDPASSLQTPNRQLIDTKEKTAASFRPKNKRPYKRIDAKNKRPYKCIDTKKTARAIKLINKRPSIDIKNSSN